MQEADIEVKNLILRYEAEHKQTNSSTLKALKCLAGQLLRRGFLRSVMNAKSCLGLFEHLNLPKDKFKDILTLTTLYWYVITLESFLGLWSLF